ncbi:MAG: type IX secretion system membrane protein PorP/SprF [Flavobacteriales bacterium]|jgi:type IX secretion system PorP/SprF family membrane protein|nr:type IX secretion system membrane protein PorP/SprF [Flavobacteriales bacterium]MBK6881709.1 type IX secretion system membrane protein PorP/SprF [Flavobacteriales bacterium]MBK7102640.1 type IX secretion system membrane protein PorP/SprF [Flavobacteriales bacterium]MBK7113374.1 type IX secretion system membrane protein PorP/SprF [Flavobacteriales bacterium]MBK7482623.1 type IX secretion system membrane protein PorP/SprF [Flavobacteriales bacterium]
MLAIRHTLLLLSIILVAQVDAQQLPQLTQYQFNDYVVNPAVAGSRPFFEIRSAHRYQWVGIQDAPRTFTFSGSSPVGEKMGVGGYIFTDIVGPTRRTGFQFSYAYHLKLTQDIKLSLAVSAGMLQFLIDGSKIQFHDPGDPVLDEQLRGDLLPDAKFGFYLYGERFWFGATAPQLLQNKVYFLDQASTLSRMEDHYYMMGGYRLPIGDDWRVEPSFLLKYTTPVPLKIDVTATIRYKDTFWLGAGFRTNDAYSAMVGYWLKKTFQFGYSYDIITSNLQNYSTGTHEVMLAVTIGKDPATREVVVP